MMCMTLLVWRIRPDTVVFVITVGDRGLFTRHDVQLGVLAHLSESGDMGITEVRGKCGNGVCVCCSLCHLWDVRCLFGCVCSFYVRSEPMDLASF